MELKWRYLLLLLLIVFLPKLSSSYYGYDLFLIPRPWVFDFDESKEDDFKQTLSKPWITVDQHGLIETLANTTGFKIASALLQTKRGRLTSLLLVDEIYKERINGTKLLIPNCDGISIYVMYLENEIEILENNPGIIDDIISGRRRVVKETIKKVSRYDGGLNVSVTRPFVYSDKEGAVVAHGAKGSFVAIESRVKSLILSELFPYNDIIDMQGLRGMGVDYFESISFSRTEKEDVEINKLSMKVEMVIVVNIVPTPVNYDIYAPGSDDWNRLQLLPGGAEKTLKHWRRRATPYKMTLLYALHF